MKTIQERRTFKAQKAKQEQDRKMIAAKEIVGEAHNEIKPAIAHKIKRIDHKTGKILTLVAAIFALTGLNAYNSAAQAPYSTKKEDTISQVYPSSGKAYKAEVEQFKKESRKTIAENKKSIATLKSKIAKEQDLMTTEYKNQAEGLERQNEALEKRIGDCKTTSDKEWRIFKTEFGKDMNALGASLKNFMKDSKQ